jgi:purine-cytosine permease-like protein
VSWAPLAADYTRHARSSKSAFGSAVVGYSVTQIAGYFLGLVALATVVRATDVNLQHDMFAAFIAVPVGWLAFGVLVLRELDESFADGYSAVVSLQNVWPHLDRRVFTIAVCGLSTVGAIWLNIASYVNFLYLLASVLVPLVAVFLVDYFGTRRSHAWDVTPESPVRPLMLAPWLLGFIAYQLLNPGYIGWWERTWHHVDGSVHLTVQSWMSASVFSFLVSAIATVPLVWLRRRRMMSR